MSKDFLYILQIIIASLVVLAIVLQQRGSALGSAFGQEGSFYSTRRGIQKKIFWTTIILTAIFIILSIANLVI